MDQHTARQILLDLQQALHSQGVINGNVVLSNWLAVLGRLIEVAIGVAMIYQHYAILQCKRLLTLLTAETKGGR